MKLRVVFDTNILFSAAGWRGAPFRCLEAARSGALQSVTCDEILNELSEKLQAKRAMTRNDARRVCAEIAAFSEQVNVQGNLSVIAADPDDDKIEECAYVAQAMLIVSGDRHLPELGEYDGIRIIPATALSDLLHSKPA